jgi:hypothetical protein
MIPTACLSATDIRSRYSKRASSTTIQADLLSNAMMASRIPFVLGRMEMASLGYVLLFSGSPVSLIATGGLPAERFVERFMKKSVAHEIVEMITI